MICKASSGPLRRDMVSPTPTCGICWIVIRRSLFLALFLAPGLAAAQQSADTSAPSAASIVESAASVQEEMAATQALIEAMQKRLEGLNTAGDNRDQELEFLQSKIGEAIRQIAGERRDTQNLQQRSAETGSRASSPQQGPGRPQRAGVGERT